MSTEVPEAAVEEVSGALTRNFTAFPAQHWVDIASGHVRSGGNQAAAQLAPGEPVEWIATGIMHRYGKQWPGAVLLVTPHRVIISASRGSIRTKREISSLYRGPESLIGLSQRVLPGGPADYWTLEINSQQGPFLFAVPNFTGSDALAQITAAFISGRARYAPETGTLLDGGPWGPPPAAPVGETPFQAARADFVPEDDGGPATAAFSWAAEPAEPAPLYTPAQPSPTFWTPETPAPVYEAPVYETPTQEAPAAHQAPTAVTYQEPAAFVPPQYTPPTESVAEPIAEPIVEPIAEPIVEPAADWYPDPLGQAGLRYWDGTAWTHHTAN